MVFTAFLLGGQHKRDGVENKPASLLVSLGKISNWMLSLLLWRAKQPTLVLAQFN